MTRCIPVGCRLSLLLVLAVVFAPPGWAIDTAVSLQVPGGAVNGEVIKVKVQIVGGSEGITFETEGLQYVRGYFDHCGFCGKPCLVNDQIQACPSPPDGCCFTLYCLSCVYSSGHEFSDRWFGGPTVEYRVNACLGPNPSKARIRGRWYGGSHEGPFYTPWYEIVVGNPIVASFNHVPADPLCAGDPILFVDTSCGGTDWHWNFGDGESADGKTAIHSFANPGSYPVTLTVSSSSGSDTETRALDLRGDCATLQGDVTDSADGAALVGATVDIGRAGWSKSVLASSGGHYTTRVAPDFTYTLTAKYPGYFDSAPGSATPGPNEAVTVDLALTPEPESWTTPELTTLANLGRQYDAIADPVNPFTGNYFFNRTLVAFPGRGDMDLAFAVSYNSLLAVADGALGFGWTHSFDVRVEASGDDHTLVMPDGSRRFFRKSGTTYLPYNCYATGILADRSPAGWKYTFPDGLVWVFDASGRLEQVTSPRNHTITLAHSAQLDRITDSMGRQIDLTWASGRIASITTPAAGGPTAQFTYDGAGNLTAIADARGNTWTFTYDGQHRLLTDTDRRGVTVLTNTYGADGRIASQADANGQLTTFTYTPLAGSRLRVVVTPPSGNAVTQVYGPNGQLLRVTDGEGHTASFGWDATGSLAAATDKLGKTLHFSSDAQGRLTSVTDRLGATTTISYTGSGLPGGITTVNGTTGLTYFATGNVREVWLPDGHLAAFAYDGQNQLTAISHNGRYWRYQYNAQGMPTRLEDPTGKARTMTYDAAGRLTQLTLPDGLGSFLYSWDANGNLIAQTNPAGQQTSFTHDAENNVTSRTFVPMSATEQLTYDTLGRVRTHTDAMGGVTTFGYDSDSNLAAVTDPDGVTARFAYDRRNLLSKITFPSGSEETLSRDANGRETARTNSLGRTLQAAFDAEGRTTAVRDPMGAVTTLARTPGSRQLSVVNPMGEKNQLALNALGDPTTFTAANGDGITAEYDAFGSVSRLVDTRGSAWRFAYDGLARVTSVTGPDGKSELSAYDAQGRLTTLTRPSGDQVTHEYTPEGRPSRIILPGGGQITFAYAYSATGLVVTATEALGVSTLIFDKLYRLTERTDIHGNTMKFAYTPGGRLAAVTYPGNRVLSYSYDTSGRLHHLTDWTGKVTTLQYDAVDRVSRLDFPNGTATTYAYDPAGRLASLAHLGPGGMTLLAHTVVRDAAGRIASVTATGTLAPSLTDETRERGVDTSNRLLFERKNAEAATFTFDADGRQVQRLLGAQVTTYTYDPIGGLSGVADGVHTTTYVRDFNGSCLRTVTDGAETRYLRDGNELWATLDAANAPTRFFVGVGTSLLYSLDSSGAIRVLHTDPQGNVVGVTDGTGALVARLAYDPWGRTLASEGQSELGYLGSFGVLTDANGLLHTGARMYDPESRRFLSEDPLGVRASPNLYTYAGGDPLNFADPLGLQTAPAVLDLGGFLPWDFQVYSGGGLSYPTPVQPPGWAPDMYNAHVRWIEQGVETGMRDAKYLVPTNPMDPIKVGDVYVTEASAEEYVSSQCLRYGRQTIGSDAWLEQGPPLVKNATGGVETKGMARSMGNQWWPKGGNPKYGEYVTRGTNVGQRLEVAAEGGAERTIATRAAGTALPRIAGEVVSGYILVDTGKQVARYASSDLVFIYNENTGRYESGDEVITNSFLPGQIATWAPPEDSQFELKKRLHKIRTDFFAGLKRNALPK